MEDTTGSQALERPSFNPNAPAFTKARTTPSEPVEWLREPDRSSTYGSSVGGDKEIDLLYVSGSFVLARSGTLADWLPVSRVALPVIVRT